MVPWFHRARVIALVLFSWELATPSVVAAQVRVGLTAGTLVYGGATTPTAGGDTNAVLRPHSSFALGVTVSYQRSAWRGRLGVEGSSPGAVATVKGLESADRTILDLVVLEPALERRLLVTSEGAAAWLEVGVSVHYWMPYTEDVRFRTGGTAALVWTQRATRHLDLSVRAHGSVSPSPFVQGDLPPELKPTTLWRWGVTLELARRL